MTEAIWLIQCINKSWSERTCIVNKNGMLIWRLFSSFKLIKFQKIIIDHPCSVLEHGIWVILPNQKILNNRGIHGICRSSPLIPNQGIVRTNQENKHFWNRTMTAWLESWKMLTNILVPSQPILGFQSTTRNILPDSKSDPASTSQLSLSYTSVLLMGSKKISLEIKLNLQFWKA